MKNLQICVNESLYDTIDEMAKFSGISRSSFCNMILADGIRQRMKLDEATQKMLKIFENKINSISVEKE